MQTDAVGPGEDFRLTIKKIADDLDSDEVQTLKYLSHDYIPNKKLEEITTGLDLFDVLCNKTLITADDNKYLAECLLTIRRIDLLIRFLKLTPQNVSQIIKTDGAQLDQFRVMIMHVIECMGAEEVKNLAFLLDGYLRKNYKKYTSGYALLLDLERGGHLGPDNLNLLEQMVKDTVEDESALKYIQDYKASRPVISHPKSEGGIYPVKQVDIPAVCTPVEVGSNPTGTAGPEPCRGGVQQARDDPPESPPVAGPCGTCGQNNHVAKPIPAAAATWPPADHPPSYYDPQNPRQPTSRGPASSIRPSGEEAELTMRPAGAVGGATGTQPSEGATPNPPPFGLPGHVPIDQGAKAELEPALQAAGVDRRPSAEAHPKSEVEPEDVVAFGKRPVSSELEPAAIEGATGGYDDEPSDLKKGQDNDISSHERASVATGSYDAEGKIDLFKPPEGQYVPEHGEKQQQGVPMIPAFLDEPEVPSLESEFDPPPPDNESVEDLEPVSILPSMLNDMEIAECPTEADESIGTPSESELSVHHPPTESDLPEDDLPTEASLSDSIHNPPTEIEDGNEMAPLQEGKRTEIDYIASKKIEEMERELRQLREEIDQREKDMPCYKIDANPRGICIIINNVHFKTARGGRTLKDRHGSDVDSQNLQYIFNKLKFTIQVYNDLTRRQIMEIVSRMAHLTDHSEYDCFSFCILSHGAAGHIYGIDGLPLEVKTVTENFKGLNCPTLKGKPKLFFIQACQGNVNQIGFRTDIQADSDNHGETPQLLPNETDFLVGYATLPGFVSYRSETHGSWYITMLTEMLEKYSDRHDLLSIMIKVNEEVSKASAMIKGGIYKQSPMPWPTLRKKVFLKST